MSSPLIQALSQKLRVSIKYFTQAVHIGLEEETFQVPLIVCLSHHSILFLDLDLYNLLGEVFYAYLEKVSETKSSDQLLRLEFSIRRPKGIPKKMTLLFSEKSKFLKFFQCYWEIDHIWRLKQVASFRVFEENIDLKLYQSLEMRKIEKFLASSPGCFKFDFKSYSFFIDNLFKLKSLASFSGFHEGNEYQLWIEIEDMKILGSFQEDLKTICEKIAVVKEDFCFVINQPYFKKVNLAGDLACWQCWEVGILTESSFFFVIVLRRKFIPPLADTFQDIRIHCQGSKYSQFFCESAADSVYSLGINQEIYLNLLQQKSDALLLDEESMDFYSKRFEIFPDKTFFAYQILISVLEILQKQVPAYKKLISSLKKNRLSKNPEVLVDSKEEPNKILDNFCRSSFFSTAGLGFKFWRKKVLRFVTFALNGGVSDGKVDLNEILSHMIKAKNDKETQKLKIFMNRLLHVHVSLNNDQFEDISEVVEKMLQSAGFFHKKPGVYQPLAFWKFNETMMKAFIETGYLKKEIEGTLDLQVYSRFLVFLMQMKTTSASLKCSICRACSVLSNNTESSLYLVPHLMDLYSRNNYSISAESSDSIISLIQKSKETKKLLINYLDVLTDKLKAKDQKVLSNTLTLLLNLCSDSSRRKVIHQSSLKQVRSLVIGNKLLPKDFLIISKSLRLLLVFITDFTCSELLALDDELITVCFEYLGKVHENNTFILEFMKTLIEKSPNSKILVGKRGIPKLVEFLKTCSSIENLKIALVVIKQLALNQNDENFKVIVAKQTEKVVERLLQNTKFNLDSGLVEQIKTLKQILA